MNKKNLESREIRLGLIHVAGLLGLTVGCIAAAFCLGYLAGSKVGFERESSTILAELPKFPVGETGGDDVGEKIANEVYAKLNEPGSGGEAPALGGDSEDKDQVPELSGIPDIKKEEAPAEIEAPPTAVDEKTETNIAVIETDKEIAADAKPTEESSIKVLGDLPPKDSPAKSVEAEKDIGSLAPPKDSGVKAAPTSKPVPTVAAVIVEKTPPPIKTPAAVGSAGTTLITKKVPPGWFAQVAAPRKVEDANQLASNLKKSGFAVTIEAAQVRGEDYFRVLVGPEGSKDQAQILLQQLKRESYLKGEPFIRMVK